MSDKTPLPLPPSTPRVHGRFTRWLGRNLLRLCGWKVAGELPDQKKLIFIIAPHTSNWDFIWGLLAKWALDLRVEFMAKRSLFWGPLGWFLRRIGGIPVDRKAADGLVESVAQRFDDVDKRWLVITPEGTRSAVDRWKSGFWRIAKQAQVPILCAYFHYPEKTVGIGPLFMPGDDIGTDMQRLREIYSKWLGKHARPASTGASA
ncbi:MAG: lysophospholipid acyltransferase family protein [Lysobacteraceae bacterium]|nr:lysophospholipid acyltransferase family protein [Xanthomonadales bacterium]HPF74512.1 lysophospholipid acyltransferase family protein [Xanthomonadaceae bacterium]HRY01308.1 lysophospholipid acyltransferase family protein [Xanthomonadaceae bacterium]